jgi:hypothetical protein
MVLAFGVGVDDRPRSRRPCAPSADR